MQVCIAFILLIILWSVFVYFLLNYVIVEPNSIIHPLIY